MDFAWVVDALRRGLKVTRKVWAGEPLYIELPAPGSNSIIAVGDDTQVENWLCLNSDIFATDWEEYVEPKKEPVFGNTKLSFDEHGQPHMGDTMPFDSICKGCFNCLWRKKGQTDCGGHPNLIRNAAGIVTECSSWILRPDTTEDVPHDSQAAKGRIDYAKGVVHCGEDTGYMAEQLEMLANLYAEKISQRVVQLLQKTDVPLSKEDTNHV